IVVPDSWRLQRIGPLPGIPRQICLRLTDYESPVDHADVVPFAKGERAVDGRAGAACHVFSTDDGAPIPLELSDPCGKLLGPVVVMKGDHIRLRQLNRLDNAQFGFWSPVIVRPHGTGQGLYRLAGTGPRKYLRQQSCNAIDLVLRLSRGVFRRPAIIRLVPHAQARMRLSLAKAPPTPSTYARNRG